MTWNDIDSKNYRALLANTKRINEINDILANLEINKKQESEEFNNHIRYLKMMLEIEDEIFEKWNIDFDKIRILLETSTPDEASKMLNNDVDLELIFDRIHERYKQYYYNKLYFEQLKNETDSEARQDTSSVIYCYNLNAELEFLALYYLEEEINLAKSEKIRENLITAKYMMMFSSTVISHWLVNNKLDNSQELLFTTPFLGEVLKLNKDGYIMGEEMCYSIACETIYALEKYTDESFRNDEEIANILVLKAQFRAAIYYLSDELIKELENLVNMLNSLIVSSILISVINNTKNDHLKHYTLSLKPNLKI